MPSWSTLTLAVASGLVDALAAAAHPRPAVGRGRGRVIVADALLLRPPGPEPGDPGHPAPRVAVPRLREDEHVGARPADVHAHDLVASAGESDADHPRGIAAHRPDLGLVEAGGRAPRGGGEELGPVPVGRAPR